MEAPEIPPCPPQEAASGPSATGWTAALAEVEAEVYGLLAERAALRTERDQLRAALSAAEAENEQVRSRAKMLVLALALRVLPSIGSKRAGPEPSSSP